MKTFFYVESTHRIKTIDCMWNIQRMSFFVENLHQHNNFFGRVHIYYFFPLRISNGIALRLTLHPTFVYDWNFIFDVTWPNFGMSKFYLLGKWIFLYIKRGLQLSMIFNQLLLSLLNKMTSPNIDMCPSPTFLANRSFCISEGGDFLWFLINYN